MNPTRRIRLQLAHQIGQRMFGRERCENVDVIRRAVDDKCLAVVCANDAAKIWKQTRFQIRVEQWSPVFGAENNVRQQVRESMRHKLKAAEQVLFQPRSGAR